MDRNLSTPPTRARRPIGRLFTTGLALSVVLGGTSAAFSAHAAALPVSANLPVTAPPKAATGPGSLGHQDGARIDPVPVAAHRYPGPSGRSGPAADSTPDITPLPAQVDLSQWDVPPGQQGAVGSCAAWAIDYSMAGWYADRLGRPTLFAPMYAYSQVHYDDSSSGGGTWPDRVYAIGEQQGIDTQADYSQGSFDFADPPTPAEQANAALYKMTPFATLYNNGGEANAPVTKPGSGIRTDLESTLAAQHPVALSIPAFIPMYQLTAAQPVLTAAAVQGLKPVGDHEVLAVGYDATGVRVENQWGTGWAAAGYGVLSWDFIQTYLEEATYLTGSGLLPSAAIPAPAPTPGPTPAPVPAAGIPTRVVLTRLSPTETRLTWAAPLAMSATAPLTGYRVTAKLSGPGTPGRRSVRTVVTSVSATATAAQVPVPAGWSAVLSVQAVNAAGAGAAATVSITMPAHPLPAGAPRALHATRARAGSLVLLSWRAPVNTGGSQITRYRITRTTPARSAARTIVVSARARSARFAGEVPRQSYLFTVTAVTVAGHGRKATAQVSAQKSTSHP